MRIREEALIKWIEDQGFTVAETVLPGTMWGATSTTQRVVYLDSRLMSRERVPTLLHEIEHIRRMDSGHQDACTERRIDEAVAAQLIDPVDYAFYESQFGWSTGGIAAELGVPRWVVSAYRRVLARQGRLVTR